MANNSSLTELHLDERTQLINLYLEIEFLSAIFLIILCPVTVIPNSLLLSAIFHDPIKCFRTPTTYFIVGLAVADLTTGLVVEPSFALFYLLKYYGLLQNHSLLSLMRTLKTVAGGISTVAISTSFLLILGFSTSQYIAVNFPHKYKIIVTKQNVILYVVISWIYFILFSLLKLTGISQKMFFKIDVILHPTVISAVLVAVNILMYRAFRRHVRKSKTKLRFNNKNHAVPVTANTYMSSTLDEPSELGTMNQDSNEPLAQERNHNRRSGNVRRQKKVERQFTLVVLHLATILLVSAFFHAVVFYVFLFKQPESFREQVYVAISLRISDWMLFVKVALDAFVYAWRVPTYRKAIFLMLCCSRSTGLQTNIIV